MVVSFAFAVGFVVRFSSQTVTPTNSKENVSVKEWLTLHLVMHGWHIWRKITQKDILTFDTIFYDGPSFCVKAYSNFQYWNASSLLQYIRDHITLKNKQLQSDEIVLATVLLTSFLALRLTLPSCKLTTVSGPFDSHVLQDLKEGGIGWVNVTKKYEKAYNDCRNQVHSSCSIFISNDINI